MCTEDLDKVMNRSEDINVRNVKSSVQLECPPRREDLLCREIDDEGVVYDWKGNLVHSLNLTAAFVFKLCDGEHSVEDITNKVASNFDVKRERAQEDVERVIEELKELRLLE